MRCHKLEENLICTVLRNNGFVEETAYGYTTSGNYSGCDEIPSPFVFCPLPPVSSKVYDSANLETAKRHL